MGLYLRGNCLMKPAFCLSLILILCETSLAQWLPDSVVLQKGKTGLRQRHERTLEGTHHLYNGAEYIEYMPLDDEHPFYLSDDWVVGELKYDGDVFTNVPMQLDIAKGKLIVSNYSNGNKLQLVNNLVESFSFEGHDFINLNSTRDSLTMRSGFYEKLYGGKTQVLARRIKKFNERINSLELIRKFEESSAFYLENNGKFFRASGKRDVLEVLAAKKKELKVFIRQNKLFSQNRESSIVQSARYFDSLNP
jgi:hypothetical protein